MSPTAGPVLGPGREAVDAQVVVLGVVDVEAGRVGVDRVEVPARLGGVVVQLDGGRERLALRVPLDGIAEGLPQRIDARVGIGQVHHRPEGQLEVAAGGRERGLVVEAGDDPLPLVDGRVDDGPRRGAQFAAVRQGEGGVGELVGPL